MSPQPLPLPKRLQAIVEWRYPNAHAYWDDCGKLVEKIEQNFKSLKCTGLKQDGFHFTGRGDDVPAAAVFYWNRTSVTAIGNHASLPEFSNRFFELVRDVLKVEKVTRLGNRLWYCYEMPSPAAGVSWLDGFSLWRFADVERGLKLGRPVNAGIVVRTETAPGRSIRLEVNAGTLTIAGAEHHGVHLDADFAVEAPAIVPDDAAGFVRDSFDFARQNLESLLRFKGER